MAIGTRVHPQIPPIKVPASVERPAVVHCPGCGHPVSLPAVELLGLNERCPVCLRYPFWQFVSRSGRQEAEG